MKKACAKWWLMAVAGMVVLWPGRGFATPDLEGAWALADQPGQACLFITNNRAWTLTDGAWLPSRLVQREDDGFRFERCDSDSSVIDVLYQTGREWKLKAFAAAGAPATSNDVVWAEEMVDSRGPIRYRLGRKMVRTATPDWDAVRDEKRFFGTWRMVGEDAASGRRGPGGTDGNPLLLKIRPDRKLIVYTPNAPVSRSHPEPFEMGVWLPLEGGWGGIRQRDFAKEGDPLRKLAMVIWLDAEGRLRVMSSREEMCFERTDETVPDPVEAWREMAETRAYHGVWGVNYEFNILMVTFDRRGKGMLGGFMMMMPFDWTVDGEGVIHCVADADVALVSGMRDPQFECRYLPETNEMELTLPADGEASSRVSPNRRWPGTLSADGEASPQEQQTKVLPFMSADVQLDAFLARLEAMKQSSEWQYELQQAKQRMENTP